MKINVEDDMRSIYLFLFLFAGDIAYSLPINEPLQAYFPFPEQVITPATIPSEEDMIALMNNELRDFFVKVNTPRVLLEFENRIAREKLNWTDANLYTATQIEEQKQINVLPSS